jgi:hypothetical protein
MFKILVAILVFAFLAPPSEAQNVSISELMAAGQEVLSDGDGDFPAAAGSGRGFLRSGPG